MVQRLRANHPGHETAIGELERLRETMVLLTAARYGVETELPTESLTVELSNGISFARRLRFTVLSPVRHVERFLPPEEIPTRGRASDTLAAVPKERLLRLVWQMQASRRWETTMKDLFLEGEDGLYGNFHAYIGQEAVAVGVIGALNGDDFIASTHRGHGHLIAKEGDLNRMSAEIFHKESGYNKGYGGSMHITDMSKGIMGANGIVGASFYMAAGAGLRAQALGTQQVSVAFFATARPPRRTTSAPSGAARTRSSGGAPGTDRA